MDAFRKLVKLLGAICLGIGMSAFFQYAGIQMSWAGKRPLAPNAESGQTIPFQNHGTMYVSQSDLNFANYFLTPAILFGVAGIVLSLSGRTMGGTEFKGSKITFVEKIGTIAQIGFILFIPFWLLENPFEALAREFNDAELLLRMNVAIGAVLGVIGLAFQRGLLFPQKQRSANS